MDENCHFTQTTAAFTTLLANSFCLLLFVKRFGCVFVCVCVCVCRCTFRPSQAETHLIFSFDTHALFSSLLFVLVFLPGPLHTFFCLFVSRCLVEAVAPAPLRPRARPLGRCRGPCLAQPLHAQPLLHPLLRAPRLPRRQCLHPARCVCVRVCGWVCVWVGGLSISLSLSL